ncbi:MAG: prenyltransferase [Deltaproteobacteria bacterium]|nr:prenyltransferase [Deltaproteobacteria bacterium]
MTTENQALEKPGFAKTWWVAIRPFALPASTMPIVFGSVLAVTIGEATFSWPLFFGALLGMVFLHTGANLLNDVFDFNKGLDVRVNPVSGAVVRGWITPKQAAFAAAMFFVLGSGIGLWLLSEVGMPILWIGVAGVAIGLLYSLGPFGLKYHALGDLAVFLDFGILGSLGAWTVQTGSLSWIPALWAVPMSLLVIGILHANNWRDIKSDSDGGIRTVASLMGDRASEFYYRLLIFGPFAAVLAIITVSWLTGVVPRMPLTFLITLLCLPLALKLNKKGAKRHKAENPLDFLALDGATAQLNLAFGVLSTGALGLHALVGCVG